MAKITVFVQRRNQFNEINIHKVKPLVWNGSCSRREMMINADKSSHPRGPAGDKIGNFSFKWYYVVIILLRAALHVENDLHKWLSR